MTRPLIGDCTVTFLKYEDPESQTVFSHSSAHILGYYSNIIPIIPLTLTQ